MMEKIHPIDLKFQDVEEAIAAFLIETSEGPVLIETGPESTFESLKAGIEKVGFNWKEIKHVFLSHIHFDHAGAAWKFAQNGARIYVHPKGAPHLASPEKLWNSAKQIYGNQMETLWGSMEPIPSDLLEAVEEQQEVIIGETKLIPWYTPGHAVHHIAWQLGRTIFTGDMAGVKINQGPVVPPCPPPDINLEDWKSSIAKINSLDPEALILTHYGKVENVKDHFENLESILDDWAFWMKGYFDKQADPQEVTPLFTHYTQEQLSGKGVNETEMEKYEKANPSWMSVAGLYRYWKLKTRVS
jgi:glyoxylase-like metal-dependent hydrolase (beta-lactamase superfamily II)